MQLLDELDLEVAEVEILSLVGKLGASVNLKYHYYYFHYYLEFLADYVVVYFSVNFYQVQGLVMEVQLVLVCFLHLMLLLIGHEADLSE